MAQISKIDRRKFLSSFIAVSVAGLTIPMWASQAFAAKKGGTLRISVNRSPTKLNPLLQRLGSEYLLGELLYSGLVRLGPNMEAVPDLAESWASSADLTQWTFKLRANARFHNGQAVTANDVVTCLRAVLDKKTGSPGRRNLGPIDTINEGAGGTVVIKTKVSYGDLPTAMAYPTAKIAPADIVSTDLTRLSREAIGSGPFKLVSFEPDRLIVVEKNPDYFLPEYPYLDRIEVMVFPDAAAEMAALISGEVDVAVEVPPAEFKRVSASSGIDGLRTKSGRFIDIVMANDRPPFNDRRIREALSLTLDRQAMIDFVAEGYGTQGNDIPVNSAYRHFLKVADKKPDIARARELLAEAGYPNGIDLTMVASVKPGYRKTLAVTVREMAKAAGFNIEVKTMPHGTYLKQVWKKGDFYVGFYNMQPTEDALFKLLFTSDAAWNETRWNNKDFDKLVEAARTTTDVNERSRLYADAQKLMADDIPALIPVFFDLLAAKHNYVENYQLHPRGSMFSLEKVSLGSGAPER